MERAVEKFVNLEEASSEGVSQESGPLSRRDFLKLVGTFALASVLSNKFINETEAFSLRSNAEESLRAEPTDVNFDDVAKSYIAQTHEEATEVANSVSLRNNASPSNICGPLAMSILMQWKRGSGDLITKKVGGKGDLYRVEGTIPPEMWLGTPTNDARRYEIAFPPSEYDRYHVKESIGRVDFDNIPGGVETLQPGDFLYLDGGSFTHYIAISRKDREGRVYCVSNLHSEEEKDKFVINEVKLWDPKTKEGYLRSWATGVGAERARTGTAGFYLWRRKKAAEHQSQDPLLQDYRDKFLNMMREQDKGEWNVEVYEIGKGELFEWRKNVPYHAASTIKTPLAVLTLGILEEAHRENFPELSFKEFLKTKGSGGRTFDQLIEATLVRSEENATETLANYCKENVNIRDAFKSIGMEDSMYEPRRTTQKDMFNFWQSLFKGSLLSEKANLYIKEKLREYTPNDDLYIGRIRESFLKAKQWNKRGVIVDSLITVQDTGFVQVGEGENSRIFYIGIAGESTSRKPMSYEEGVVYFDRIMDLLTEYLVESSEKKRALFRKSYHKMR